MNNYNITIQEVRFFKNEEYTFGDKKFPQCSGMVISWSANVGFGELTIITYPDGSYCIDTECMDENFVKEVMEEYKKFIISKL